MGPGSMGFMHGPHGPGFHDPAARLEHLKTELGIRPEQQPAWDAYVKAVRDNAEQMRSLHASVDPEALRAMSWQDLQTFKAKMHDREAASFRTEQTAATKLLAALDDGQKTQALLPVLLHVHGPGMFRHGPGMWGGGPDAHP
jgi:hypothetical protein